MAQAGGNRKQLALVYGTLPTVEEIDQFLLVANDYEVTIVSSESICGYLTQTSYFQNLRCMALPDHHDNTTYLPGLEKVLSGFDVVVVKERLGMYAFQAVKAKWRSRFRLVCWIDNATPFPGQDIAHMRTIRNEVTNAADALFVQTEAARGALMLEGVEDQRIMSFLPYVESRTTRNAKGRARALERLGLGDTDFAIAHVGQIEWEEGLFDLVHAVKLLERQDRSLAARTKLIFCGIGSFSTELRDRLVALGLDRQAVYVAPSRDAFETVMTAADCMYYAAGPARDRMESEPYRLTAAMAAGVPILAPRSPLVEELCGKHRLDFCQGSPDSLARAIKKAAGAAALRGNVANKAQTALKGRKAKAAEQMREILAAVSHSTPTVDVNALDHQVLEAEALVNSKQYLAAIDLIESIFKVANIPLHHKANLYRLVGDCFTKLGDGEGGKNAYVQAVEIDPYSAKAFIGLGTVSLMKNSFETAVIHFQKAIGLAPQDEMANLGLGLAFQGLGEHEESSRWVTKAVEINPENQAALFTLVQVGTERGKFGEIEAALDKYTALRPNDHNMLYTLAAIKHKVGKNKEAKALVDRIIAVDPYDDRAVSLDKQISRAARVSGETAGNG